LKSDAFAPFLRGKVLVEHGSDMAIRGRYRQAGDTWQHSRRASTANKDCGNQVERPVQRWHE